MGRVLELAAPGMEEAGETEQVRAAKALVFGQSFEGFRGGGEHGLVGEGVRGADEGAQGCRDGEGEKQGRPGQLLVQMAISPLLGCTVLALGTVPVAAGVMDAVWWVTGWARREAMSRGSAAAMLDGADDLAVCEGQRRRALQGLWGEGVEDVAEGGHGRSPCMRAWRRT